MLILTILLSTAIVFFKNTEHKIKIEHQRRLAQKQQMFFEFDRKIMEQNKNAGKNCIIVKGLCVTNNRISYKTGDNFIDSLNNAKNVCSELDMRIPTKEEYDLILTPLTDFKYKLEHNPSDEEFVNMSEYYKNSLRNYHLQFWNDDLLTSSIQNSKAVTYKIKLKQYPDNDGCRRVNTGKVHGEICIEQTIDTPIVEYHDFSERIDKSRYASFTLHCVK